MFPPRFLFTFNFILIECRVQGREGTTWSGTEGFRWATLVCKSPYLHKPQMEGMSLVRPLHLQFATLRDDGVSPNLLQYLGHGSTTLPLFKATKEQQKTFVEDEVSRLEQKHFSIKSVYQGYVGAWTWWANTSTGQTFGKTNKPASASR